MSAYVEIETVYKDPEALIDALCEIDNAIGRQWTRDDIEVHENAVPLVGYRGRQRDQKANIIIRRHKVQGSANDIGFERMDDGTYRAHISEFDSGKYDAAWRKRLNVKYGEKFVEKHAMKNGYRFRKKVQSDGSIKMTLSRWR